MICVPQATLYISGFIGLGYNFLFFFFFHAFIRNIYLLLENSYGQFVLVIRELLWSGCRSEIRIRSDFSGSTVCPRSSDPFYILTYYIKWVTGQTVGHKRRLLNLSKIFTKEFLKSPLVPGTEPWTQIWPKTGSQTQVSGSTSPMYRIWNWIFSEFGFN